MNHAISTHSETRATALRIAFIDDSPEIRQLAAEWLSSAGHDVTCAGNGNGVARAAREGRFDLVITDLVMPDKDGYEIIRDLKEGRPDVRILAISGGTSFLAQSDCLRMAKNLGAHDVLAKPFNRAQLTEAIERAMSAPASA